MTTVLPKVITITTDHPPYDFWSPEKLISEIFSWSWRWVLVFDLGILKWKEQLYDNRLTKGHHHYNRSPPLRLLITGKLISENFFMIMAVGFGF